MVLAGVLALCCAGLSGCKTSDVLTELLVDQSSEDIDYDNQSRFVNNLLTALIDTERLAQLLQDDIDFERDRVEEQAIEGDEANDSEQVPQSEYRETTDALGETAAPSQSTGSTSQDGSSQGDLSNEASAESDEQAQVYRGSGGSGLVYGSAGTYTELPEGVQTVVAFGECANMVASFAGAHALVGADAGFLGNDFIQRAYGDVIADAQTIAVDEAAQTIDVAAVAAIEPDALFLLTNSYTLSDADLALLAEHRIDVVYLPALSSASNITATATYIGQMFGGSDNTFSGKDARAAAAAYVAWHDNLVNGLIQANGGLASSVNYDTGGTENLGTISSWTLYVDDWDYASYAATPDNMSAWTDTAGVAISKVGYRWSPLSYYLSVGGSNNNAATFKSSLYDVTADYYVWQFNLGRVTTSSDANWSGRTKTVSPLSNSGTADLLVIAQDGSTTLGSESFSYVIVRTQSIKAAFEASRAQDQGLYTTYGFPNSQGRGFLSSTGSLCESYISGSFDIVVNPCGLYSSWIDGSPESVLEAVWANDLNTGSSQLDGYIREYYQLFYGYELSDAELQTIRAGLAG